MKSATGVIHQVRLATGLILFTYLVTHFLNHSLGLISLAAAEAGLAWFRALWDSWVALALLLGALTIHLGLAFWSLWRRRSLRLQRWEAVQLLVGLMVPPLLAVHVLGTRGAEWWFDITPSYAYVLVALWAGDLGSTLRQAATLLLAWLHGCIGLHFWLRLKPWYAGAAPWMFAAALLLPTLALLGFVFAGREVVALMADPAWRAELAAHTGPVPPGATAAIYGTDRIFLIGYLASLALVLAARLVRDRLNRRRAVIVTYADGRRVEVLPGTSILEASRGAGIPHAAICGGRGRCSTCRVRVHEGGENLSPMATDEAHVLQRVGAPPGVRLACQARPTGPVTVEPLLPPSATPRDARPRPGYLQGHEEEIAILFADLRAFTALAEQKLPYDVVFLLNRFFDAIVPPIIAAGGSIDKYLGDGLLAVFETPDEASSARAALRAAANLSAALAAFNLRLEGEGVPPIRIGAGLHLGELVLGEIGAAGSAPRTIIGDTVNTASRLEGMTKELGVEVLVSRTVLTSAGIGTDTLDLVTLELRGVSAPLAALAMASGQDLEHLLAEAASPA